MAERDPATSPNVPPTTPTRNELALRPPDARFDLAEASTYTGLAERTLRNAVARRSLQPDGRGRSWVFTRSTLDTWLEARARRRS